MHSGKDTIGYIRVVKPRYTEVGQRRAMAEHGIDNITVEGRDGTLADVIRMMLPGRILAVHHALLLSDPKDNRKPGGSRASFWKAFDGMEAKGGVLLDLYSGLSTENRADRDKLTRQTIEALARGRHKTRRSDRRGRPPKEFTDAQWDKAEAVWFDKRLTWAEKAAKLPKGMSVDRAYRRFRTKD